MLLYSDSNFIQVIEGDLQAINELYSRITNDRRPTGFIKLLKGEIQTRNFPEWSMGFKKISNEDYSAISGYEMVEGNNSPSLNRLGEVCTAITKKLSYN
jgi:hypothetical protein